MDWNFLELLDLLEQNEMLDLKSMKTENVPFVKDSEQTNEF